MIKKIFAFVSLSLFSLTACGTESETLISPAVNSSVSSYSETKSDKNIDAKLYAFINSVSKIGVTLNNKQLETIAIQRHLKTSGKFASRPAVNLTSEKNLQVHFDKHKKEFPKIKTKEDYLKAAIDFHNSKSPTANYYFDTTSFDKGYQSNVVKYDSKTHELSALRSDGDITTYYTSDEPSPKRFVLVPEDFKY